MIKIQPDERIKAPIVLTKFRRTFLGEEGRKMQMRSGENVIVLVIRFVTHKSSSLPCIETVFPDYFSTYLKGYLSSFVKQSPLSSDQRIFKCAWGRFFKEIHDIFLLSKPPLHPTYCPSIH